METVCFLYSNQGYMTAIIQSIPLSKKKTTFVSWSQCENRVFQSTCKLICIIWDLLSFVKTYQSVPVAKINVHPIKYISSSSIWESHAF